jgi:hypothetical protein
MSDKPMSHTEGGPAKIQTAKAPAESTTQVLSLKPECFCNCQINKQIQDNKEIGY